MLLYPCSAVVSTGATVIVGAAFGLELEISAVRVGVWIIFGMGLMIFPSGRVPSARVPSACFALAFTIFFLSFRAVSPSKIALLVRRNLSSPPFLSRVLIVEVAIRNRMYLLSALL